MKALVFTSSYNRTAMLRGCVQDFLNQSYEDCVYSLNIACDADKIDNVLPLYDDLADERVHICVTTNVPIHFNHMNAIKNIPNWEDYDVFIKMDDDDFYKKNYVRNIVKLFVKNPDVDITSTKIKYQLNGNSLFGNPNLYDNLGGNGSINSHMPMTLAFNKKALDLIMKITGVPHNNDDMLWRRTWEAAGLAHKGVDNSKEIIWHIHGKNVSTSNFLQ